MLFGAEMAHCLHIYDRMWLAELQLYDVFIKDFRKKAVSSNERNFLEFNEILNRSQNDAGN
jgi:hypothetical protein